MKHKIIFIMKLTVYSVCLFNSSL